MDQSELGGYDQTVVSKLASEAHLLCKVGGGMEIPRHNHTGVVFLLGSTPEQGVDGLAAVVVLEASIDSLSTRCGRD